MWTSSQITNGICWWSNQFSLVWEFQISHACSPWTQSQTHCISLEHVRHCSQDRIVRTPCSAWRWGLPQAWFARFRFFFTNQSHLGTLWTESHMSKLSCRTPHWPFRKSWRGRKQKSHRLASLVCLYLRDFHSFFSMSSIGLNLGGLFHPPYFRWWSPHLVPI